MRRPTHVRIATAISALAMPFAQISIAAPAADAALAPPSLAIYGQLPTMEYPALSPAGDRLACISRHGDRRYIMVSDLKTGKTLDIVRVDDTKVRDLRWYDDDRLLILYSTTSYPPFGVIGSRSEWFMLGTWDIASKRYQPIDMHDDKYETMNAVSGSLEVRLVSGQPTLFVSGTYLDQREREYPPALFKVDVQDERTMLVAEGDTEGADWAVDAEGRIAASFDYEVSGSDQGQWILRLRRGDDMRQVATGNSAIDHPYIVGFSYDDKSLLVAFDTSDGWIWKPLRLADATWGAPLGAGRTFFDVTRNRLTGQVIGGVQDSLDPHQVFFDPSLENRWSAIMGVYSGERVELVSHSDDFSELLILSSVVGAGARIAWLRSAAGQLPRLGHHAGTLARRFR